MTISLRLSSAEAARIKTFAEAKGISASELIRQAVSARIESASIPAVEVAAELDAVVCKVKSLLAQKSSEITKPLDYNITLRIEALREVAAGILADYTRYMIRNKISSDDLHNPIAVMAHEVFVLKEDLLRKCEASDDINVTEVKLHQLKSMLERLDANGNQ